MSDEVPIIIGNAGLTGRQEIVRDYSLDFDVGEDGHPVVPAPTVGKALPPPCLRKLQIPKDFGCNDCPGRQEDGSCLSEVVQDANAAGCDWTVEVSWDAYGHQHWTFLPS